MKDSFNEIFLDKRRVMIVLAHPDDMEIMSGGLVARLVKEGKEVLNIKVTGGNKGSRQNDYSEIELTEKRNKESNNACEILGIKKENNINLEISDGSVENNLETIGKIAKQIRLFKPDLIITQNPEDVVIIFDKENHWVNHRDHRNTGKSAVDAVYPYSRDLLFFPEHFLDKNAKSHNCTELLFVDYYNHSECVDFEITEFFHKKVQAIAAHESQIEAEHAVSMADFLSPEIEGKRFERFRHVVID